MVSSFRAKATIAVFLPRRRATRVHQRWRGAEVEGLRTEVPSTGPFTGPMLSHRVVVLNEDEVIAEDNPNEAMREQRVVDGYLGRPHVVA